MKILFENCVQEKPYDDSNGQCIILLGNGDNVQKIIAEYTKSRPWYEKKYENPRLTNRYEMLDCGKQIVYEGNLLVFDTYREYLD